MNNEILRFIRYLSFKMDCLRYQEENPLTLDVEKAQKHFDELEAVILEKTEKLSEVMPQVVVKSQNKPKNCYKQDGSYSKHGKEWFDLLKELKLPETTVGPIPVEYAKGNPKSVPQVKEWLFSLGWKPDHFKYTRNKITGDEKKVEQVRYTSQSDPRKGQLTDSVLKLKDREPDIEVLEGLTVAQHRKSVFDGFLKASKGTEVCKVCCGGPGNEGVCLCGHKVYEGTIVSSAGGFTNTLRLKHRSPIVNLPGVDAAWGKEIRGCLVAPAGQVMVGSDVSSLESSTKRHFMWDYDPDYVNEMSKEGFDEHINLAKFAGAISQEDEDRYKKGNGSDLKPIRNTFKPANYAGVYGVKEKTLSRQTGMSIKECAELLKAYWDRNWAVLEVAKDQYTKTLKDGTMWLKNPVSGFYYSLRYEKDIFSTLNQGTGVFIFDSWVMRMRKLGVHPQMQYHDEVLLSVPSPQTKDTEEKLHEAMRQVNETLKLNVDILVDVETGENYAECH